MIRITDYYDIRNQIETGDVLLCSGKGGFSIAIQKFTDSTFSHVGVIVKFKSLDRIMVAESMEGKGVRLIPLTKHLLNYKGELYIYRHKDFSKKIKPIDFKKIGQMIFDRQGDEYDMREIARIGKRIILEKTGIKKLFNLNFKANDNDKDICSEFAKYFFETLGFPIPYNKNGCITPPDFAEDPFRFMWRIK